MSAGIQPRSEVEPFTKLSFPDSGQVGGWQGIARDSKKVNNSEDHPPRQPIQR